MHANTHALAHACTRTDAYTRTHTRTHSYTRAHTHAHTRTHTHRYAGTSLGLIRLCRSTRSHDVSYIWCGRATCNMQRVLMQFITSRTACNMRTGNVQRALYNATGARVAHRYDTPGVVVMNRLHAMLPPRELTELLPTKQMRILTYAAPLRSHTDSAVESSAVVDRRRYRVEPGQSLLLGGSVRATLRAHPHGIRSYPIRSDPIRSDPIRSDSILSDPIRSDPIRSDPILSDPILSDPNRCLRLSVPTDKSTERLGLNE